ncbi:MAG: autotransporter-associated beta strand repeat-containing protein [Opitutaceae bacterium]|jgi:autotransporter-associated beta strand protein
MNSKCPVRNLSELIKAGLAAALITTVFFAPSSVCAASLYWDSDATGTGNVVIEGTGLGGTGSWDTSLSNWWSGSGTSDTTWTNGADTAVFWGTAGTVTLAAPVTVGGLQFNTTGYTLNTDSTNLLTFGAGTDTITLNNIAAATITGPVTGAGDVTITRSNGTSGTLTLNGTSATGWTGTTAISNGVTVALSGENQALFGTSSIALGGSITLTNTAAQATLDRVSDSAAITSNGGIITYANTAAAGTAYAETIGSVGLTSGALNIVLGTNQNASSNTQTLTLSGLTQAGASTVAFSAATTGPNATTNQIKVTGAAATTAGQIIGPWATVGTATNAQTDYAVYNGTENVVAAGIAASAETSWTASTDSYTLSGGTTLTGTRTITALRATGAAQTLALGGNTLETNGILNGGTGTLTISGAGVVRQQGTDAGNLYVNAGNSAITISAIIANNTGVLSLVKTGTGTLTLGGANTYTGTTTVQEGTLVAGSSPIRGNVFVGSLGGGPAAVFGSSSATTAYASGIDVTVYSNGTLNVFGGATPPRNLTIIGGTAAFNSGYFSGTLTMTGGSATGTMSNGTSSTIVTNASAATASISANISMVSNTSFTVADGDAAIDLNFTGVKNDSLGTRALTKSGAGVLALGGANGYSGATTVNAGTLLLRNSLALQNSALANGGTGIVFDSSVATHAFTIGGLNGSGNLALRDNAGTPGAVALTVKAGSYSGVLSGAGSLIKSGAGTQTLSGVNTYTGNTTISAGTLALGAAGTFANSPVINLGTSASQGTLNLTAKTSGFTFGTGQTLSGYGTVNIGAGKLVTFASGSTLAPGNSPGIVNVTGDLTLASGSTTNMEIVGRNGGAPVAGTDFDQVIVSGALAFGGTLNIDTTGLSGLVAGDSFGLFTAAFYTPGFTGVAMTGAYAPTFEENLGVWTGIDAGLLFTFTEANGTLGISAVPEPATYAAIFGALALAGVVWRRRSRV